ncbi:hypothetical protein [Streptomyces adustus]|uniref:hypothetical protein n=1 Tax=Streptomyces adustus TaxID=1609272 RepID=UPI003710FF6D
MFCTDRRAARTCPTSTQAVEDAEASAVRAAVGGTGAQVLTGDARRPADADPDRDGAALTAMNALSGTAGGW